MLFPHKSHGRGQYSPRRAASSSNGYHNSSMSDSSAAIQISKCIRYRRHYRRLGHVEPSRIASGWRSRDCNPRRRQCPQILSFAWTLYSKRELCRTLTASLNRSALASVVPLTLKMDSPRVTVYTDYRPCPGVGSMGYCRSTDSRSTTCTRVITHLYLCPTTTCNVYHTTLRWVLSEHLIMCFRSYTRGLVNPLEFITVF